MEQKPIYNMFGGGILSKCCSVGSSIGIGALDGFHSAGNTLTGNNMKTIIKHGKMTKKVTCPHCGCEFTFGYDDYETRPWSNIHAVYCPECNSPIPQEEIDKATKENEIPRWLVYKNGTVVQEFDNKEQALELAVKIGGSVTC